MSAKISIILLSTLVVITSVTLGYVGTTYVSRESYYYYEGLSSDIENYAGATGSLMSILQSWATPFVARYDEYKPQYYELYTIKLIRHTEIQGVITEQPAYIVLYLKKGINETYFNGTGGTLEYYRVYGYKDTVGSMIEYLLTRTSKKWAYAKSFVNGDKLLHDGNGSNANLNTAFMFTLGEVIYPAESINTVTTWYIYNGMELYNNNIEGLIRVDY